MDVQTENADPPPCESQPSGKIRKGFKLFGKRKPGNIFSIRSKSEGNNKSPVNGSKALDGAPEPAAPDSEHDPEKEKGQALIHRDGVQEEEPLGEDGVLAAAPARTSISSASSAKSLGFLSILRGGRRGVGERRAHTVSQSVGRQRRGIKGLFGNVKFRSKDKDEKEEKEEIPPSPLLMSSRSSSVEIIKEDLTLTPKSQPRFLDSPETESSEPTKSLTTQDSLTSSPSKTETVGNVSKSNEFLSTSQAAMVPGETSLSSLLADISSLLTFDSISGGGDIMADVEAEWGKASSAVSYASPSYTSFLSKSTVSSSLTTFSISTAKPTPASLLTTASARSSSTVTSSPIKPSSIITTLTKSSTLTTQTVKSTWESSSEQATSVPTQSISTKPSTTPLINISAPIMSLPPITMKTTSGLTSTTTAPPNTPATPVKSPSASPTLTSTVTKLVSEITETPKTTVSVSKPSPVAAPPPALAKTTPVVHSPPTPAAFTQSSATKQDWVSSLQAVSSNKAPVTVSVTSTVTASPPVPLISSKMPTTEVTPAPVSVPAAFSKPAPTSCNTDLNKASPSIVTELPSSTGVTSTKPLSSFAPSSTLTSLSPAPPFTTTPASAAVSLHETTPAPKMPPPPSPSQSITTPALTKVSVSQVSPASMAPPTSKAAPLSVSKAEVFLAPAERPLSVSKSPISDTQIPASSPQFPPAFTQPALSQFTPASCPVSSPPLSSEGPAKKRESGQFSLDGHLTSPKSLEARDVLQQDSQQDKKRTSQGNTTGVSKIPVVGGGRAGKIPVRVSPYTEEEANRDVPMSGPEEASPHFNSHDIGRKDQIGNSEAAVATSKHSQEDNQQLPQPKASTCLPRDSKIPVKHGSQIPQAKDPTRTKIPVSKVPVRRTGTKPTAPSVSTQIRK